MITELNLQNWMKLYVSLAINLRPWITDNYCQHQTVTRGMWIPDSNNSNLVQHDLYWYLVLICLKSYIAFLKAVLLNSEFQMLQSHFCWYVYLFLFYHWRISLNLSKQRFYQCQVIVSIHLHSNFLSLKW